MSRKKTLDEQWEKAWDEYWRETKIMVNEGCKHFWEKRGGKPLAFNERSFGSEENKQRGRREREERLKDEQTEENNEQQ